MGRGSSVSPGRIENDPQLFDVSRTTAALCPACKATRLPNEQRAPACAADRDHERRPHNCLNRIDNATTPWPNGY
jgi:hypothetical protein